MVADMVADHKKMPDIKLDMMPDMEVDKLAEMFKTKCITPKMS